MLLAALGLKPPLLMRLSITMQYCKVNVPGTTYTGCAGPKLSVRIYAALCCSLTSVTFYKFWHSKLTFTLPPSGSSLTSWGLYIHAAANDDGDIGPTGLLTSLGCLSQRRLLRLHLIGIRGCTSLPNPFGQLQKTVMADPVKLAAFAGQEAYLRHNFMALFHACFRSYFAPNE